MEPNKELKQQSLEYLSKLYKEGYVEKRYQMFEEGEGGIPHEWGQLRTAFESGANTWKSKYDELKAAYDKLKGENDNLQKLYTQLFDNSRDWITQYKDLKEKADKIAEAFKRIQVIPKSVIGADTMATIAKNALTSYNSNTNNQNENNG